MIAVQDNIGAILLNANGAPVTDTAGRLTRFGGITIAKADTGKIIALGNIYGDIVIKGAMSGRLTAEGEEIFGLAATRFGILGNVTISSFAAGSAIISGRLVGDAAGKTLATLGSAKGIVAAEGAVSLAKSTKLPAANLFANLQGGANGTVLADIFTDGSQPLLFDTGGPLAGLALIEADLAALHGSGGSLSGPTP